MGDAKENMSDTTDFDFDTDIDATVDSILSRMDVNTDTQEEEAPEEAESHEEDGNAEGDEPEATDTEDPELSEEGTDTFEVIVDGKKERKTREELISGYQKGSDYSRKTQALADERKALEAERATVQARFEQEHKKTMEQAMAIALADPILAEAQNTDWNRLSQDDPAEYVSRKARTEARVAQIKQLQSQMMERDQSKQIQARAEFLAKERTALLERIPEWKDEAVASREVALSQKYMLDSGYTKEEIDSIIDSRMAKTIREAALYRQHLEATKSVESKKVAKPVANSVRPGPVKMGGKSKTDALKRASRPGASTDERVNAILKLI